MGPKLPPRVSSVLARASTDPYLDGAGNYIPPFHVESLLATKQVVASGDGVAILPLVLVEAELEAATLVVLDYHPPWLRTQYGFAWPRGRPLSTAATAFMAEVRAVEAEQIRNSAANR